MARGRCASDNSVISGDVTHIRYRIRIVDGRDGRRQRRRSKRGMNFVVSIPFFSVEKVTSFERECGDFFGERHGDLTTSFSSSHPAILTVVMISDVL